MPTLPRFTSDITTEFAQLATRAADLPDRCEAAGALVVAALLHEIAQEVE
jgi:hypothetical protein